MDSMIEQQLRDEVQQALEPGEELLWAGRPDPLRFARAKIVPMLIGALFLLVFYLVYRSSLTASATSANTASRFFTLRPAILTSGGMLTLYSLMLPVLAYRKARRTAYGATDRRVISLSRGRPAQTLPYDGMQLPILNLTGHHGGDIWFIRKLSVDAVDLRTRAPLFMGIREAEQVHRLVQERIAGRADEQTDSRAVRDYLDLLLQGKRTLDEELYPE